MPPVADIRHSTALLRSVAVAYVEEHPVRRTITTGTAEGFTRDGTGTVQLTGAKEPNSGALHRSAKPARQIFGGNSTTKLATVCAGSRAEIAIFAASRV
jgi:hypothetical protein